MGIKKCPKRIELATLDLCGTMSDIVDAGKSRARKVNKKKTVNKSYSMGKKTPQPTGRGESKQLKYYYIYSSTVLLPIYFSAASTSIANPHIMRGNTIEAINK